MEHLVWIAPLLLLLVAGCWGIYVAVNEHAQSQRKTFSQLVEKNYQSIAKENYIVLAECNVFRANRSSGSLLRVQRWIRSPTGQIKLYKALAADDFIESSLIDVSDNEARRWLRWQPGLFLKVLGRKPTWKDDWKSSTVVSRSDNAGIYKKKHSKQ
jgi:sensor c-di-GMP phosphodiesterase-like protein